MDGKYPSDSYAFTAKQRTVIKTWIQNTIANKKWEGYFFIPIDAVHKRKGRYKKYWVSISISLVHYANQFLQAINRTDIVGIVDIPLYANEQFLMGFNFKNLENIYSEFDLTPPSLFIFPKQSTEFSNIYRNAIGLGELLIGERLFNVLGYEYLFKGNPIKHSRGVILMPTSAQVTDASSHVWKNDIQISKSKR
ncbi:MAG: hypothetical protein ACX93T_03765 [Bacteroidota bacterium]